MQVDWPKRALSSILVLALMWLPEMASAQSGGQETQPAAPTTTQAQASDTPANQEGSPAAQSNQLPDSPGAVPRPTAATTERPLGTAAAETGTATGTAASKPAGVAIAPGKQRQSRSFLIKLGAVIGVGVAIGTVVALSNASPGRPQVAQ
ncbi:MAG TPA: hypothetical protein VGF06_01235 [Terriglobales bacterium]|jgi:hypothetical protein